MKASGDGPGRGHRLLAGALALAAWLCAASVAAEGPRVVASILPLHSLVSAVMEGVAEPVLLVSGSASPHDYQLRPSDARALQSAALVFRVGPELESFLDKPLRSLGGNARVVDLLRAPGVRVLAARSAGTFDVDGAAGHDDHAHGHADGGVDGHVWLSPVNADALLIAIRDAVTAVDPANAARYASNTDAARARVAQGERRWQARLATVRDVPYLVFHDAFQHLERHFGLHPAGALTLSPERQPSARRVAELRHRVVSARVRCVFREPQFRADIVDVLVEGTAARVGVLDPVGAGLAPGPEAWFHMMEANVESLASCLSQQES